MASVTFSASVGGDNSTVSDDSNPTTGLANGGHRTRFVPALAQLVAVASYVVSQASVAGASASAASGSASTASAAAGTATTQAAAAAASAVAAANSAAATQSSNVNGTSTNSITIATANGQSKALTYAEAGRAIVNGMFLVFAAAASPSVNWMLIQVTGWNSGTRVVTGDVVAYQGSGTYASWVISGPSGPQGPAGEDADLLMPWTARSGAVTLVEGDKGGASKLTSATVTFDTPAALGNGWTHVVEGTSGTSTLTAAFADGSASKTLTQGRTAYLACDGTAIRLAYFGSAISTDQLFGTVGTAQVITAASSNNDIAICQLSATLAMVIYRNASGFPQAAIVDQTGAKVSGHTPIQLEAAASQATMQVIRVSATTAIAVWGNGTNAKAVHLTVSGNVITAGSVLAASSDNCNAVAICLLTATKFIIAYYKITGDALCARTLTLSGTTLTANTEYTLAATPGSGLVVRLAAMSSTQVLATFCGSSLGTVARGLVITEASNVLTFPSHASYCATGSANTTGQGDIVRLTATRAVAVVGSEGDNTGYGNALVVDFSGTGASATMNGGRPTMVAPGGSTIGHRLALLSSATVLHLGPVGASLFTSVFLEALAISGDGVFQGASVLIARTTGIFDLCVLSSTTALVAYVDSSNSNYPTVKPVALGTVV